MDHFRCETKVVSGAGALSVLGQLGCKRLLVVADPYFVKDGTVQRVTELAGAETAKVFSKVQPDPSVELAAEGTALMKQFRPDVLAALGGGSAMDCAKAMVYFSGLPVKLVAIPTTSGSGSEVTDFAILTYRDVKHPLVDKKLLPYMAILDSDLLQNLPASLIADTGFDVLSHALEAVAATGASAISDALARDAFCQTFLKLRDSFKGDRTVRLAIHNAATMAGMSFSQAGLGLCHGISHSLGGVFHIPHGRLNAILLPAVVACNEEKAAKQYADLARQAGLGGSADTVAVRNLRNGLIRLRRELHMPATLAEAGVPPRSVEQKLEQIVVSVLQDPCCGTNPVKPDAAMVRRIIGEVMGHG